MVWKFDVAGDAVAAVTIHAILLPSLALGTLAVCLLTRQRSWGRKGVLWACLSLVLAYVTAEFILGCCAHMCDAGNPTAQALIGGCCLWAVLVIPRFVWLRPIGAVLVILATFGLSRQYVGLVHAEGMIGHASIRDGPAAEGVRMLPSLRASVRLAVPPASQPYPAGWLRDMPFAPRLCRLDRPIRVEITPFWHSWYSRLYKRRVVRQDFWFPGGVLPDRAEQITLRDRDSQADAR